MIIQEKLILAYRYKESKNIYKKGFIATIFMSIASTIIAIILMTIKANESDKIYKIISVSLMIFCAIFFLCMIPLINKTKIQVLTNNQYPREAIYFENGYICILTEVITKIKISDIKKVSIINNMKFQDKEVLKQSFAKAGGSISIITENEKFYVPQLENVEQVKNEILRLKETKMYIVDDVYFVLNKNNEYEAICNFNEVKANIIFDNSEEKLIFTIDTTKYILRHFKALYENILNNVVRDITPVANDWNEDKNISFTEEEIKFRLDKKQVEIQISGEKYLIYFDDDNIFSGHSIVYNGSINESDFCVDIIL